LFPYPIASCSNNQTNNSHNKKETSAPSGTPRGLEWCGIPTTPTTASSSFHSVPALLREVAALQERIQELQRELEDREEEKEKLQQALNLENFKYELLVDLVSW
jgi:hypothetical protein